MRVKYNKKFIKMFAKAPQKIKTAFGKRLELLMQNPYHPRLEHHTLSGKYAGFKSINITGDWRALFQEKNNRLEFLLIGTHSQLYK